MRKPIILAVTTLSTGLMLLGLAHAQQQAAPATPATTPQNPPAKSATSPAPAAKTGTGTTAKKKPAPAPLTLTTPRDKASYAYGLSMGEGMKKNSVDLDPSIIYRGIKDGLGTGKPLMTDEEVRAAISAFQTDLRQKQQAKTEALAASNKKEGDAFLTENKGREGVVTLPSGLQYKILQPGDGPKPTAADTVVCNYKGTLLDNTEFDSSYKRGQPATFPVSGVIRGWTEALQLMPVGSKWQLFIPSDLAYGPRGTPGGNIGPNATLVFEVELLSIKPKTPPAAPNPAPNATPNPGASPNPNPNAPPNPNPAPTPNPPPNPNPPNPAPNPNPTPNPTPTPTVHN